MSMLVALTIKNYYFYYVVCFCTVPGLLFDKCLFTETFEHFRRLLETFKDRRQFLIALEVACCM